MKHCVTTRSESAGPVQNQAEVLRAELRELRNGDNEQETRLDLVFLLDASSSVGKSLIYYIITISTLKSFIGSEMCDFIVNIKRNIEKYVLLIYITTRDAHCSQNKMMKN